MITSTKWYNVGKRMTIPKKYFHDHLVLLLLSTNVFLTIADTIFILLRLSTTHGNGFIVQYRPSLGINVYTPGNIVGIFSFIVFAWLILIIHTILSMRIYNLNRYMAITILSLGVLLLILTVLIVNSLLLLR